MYFKWNERIARHIISRFRNAADDISLAAYDSLGISDNRHLRNMASGDVVTTVDQTIAKVVAMAHIAAERQDTSQRLYISTEDPREVNMAAEYDYIGSTETFHTWLAVGNGNVTSSRAQRVSLDLGEIRRLQTAGPQTVEDNGLVFQTESNIVIARPTPELLETIPASARPFAVRVGASTGQEQTLSVESNDGVITWEFTAGGTGMEGVAITGAQLIVEAREAYRSWLRLAMGRAAVDPAEIERQRQAREASAARFSAFVRRTSDTDKHVPTLPFVPHGLSSSRRWGIEVESGGARGVNAPDQWNRIGDGSLRSAYNGYVEVQDFEPFDEEVTTVTHPNNCPNSQNHIYVREVYNRTTEMYEYTVNPDYINPAECTTCGENTQIVRRTPRTIHHTERSGDCAEFVSPILVSMHSNGLKTLTDALILQPQNASAGVHVHVEADDLSDEQVAALIFGYDVMEPILEASYQRENRRYCNRREAANVLAVARKLRGASKPTREDVRGGDRYVTLNTTSLNQHGTIEFRAMGPVYDYDYLVRWAMLCRELVNIAKAGVTVKQFSQVKTWQDILNLMAKYGKEYVRAAVYEATGDTGHAADLAKRNEPVTTEAVNADLTAVISAGSAMHASLARQFAIMDEIRIPDVSEAIRSLSDRLVAVGSVGTGRLSTWMA